MAVRSAVGPNQNDSWEDLTEVRSAGGAAALNISKRILVSTAQYGALLSCVSQETGCPYVSGMEPSTVREVLFSAGEARIRILQWLVSRQVVEASCTRTLTQPSH